ncbi:hypothetical protein B0T10DRAFT_581723 [Thelonectria olida]|uniref:Uncharacterized protein n=1 Tax=Thelonectria olida TaxID=1576542 RepID=A0A9P8VVX6_9HYPO|nr:hypothetical protein B0T10DRAFT_581723 [Thelonectria olida]
MSNESAPKYYVDEDGERVEIPEPDPGAQKRGLHGALVNPNNSEDAKQHAREVLKEKFDEDYKPPTQKERLEAERSKDPNNINRGLLAALHNDRVHTDTKVEISERLIKSGAVDMEEHEEKGIVL